MLLDATSTHSRRRFIRRCAGVGAAALLGLADAQDRVGQLQIKLVQEFPGGFPLGVSPDGIRICIYDTPFSLPKLMSWITQHGPEGAFKSDLLKVIEVGSWRTVCSVWLRGQRYFVSFFGGGESLYAETLSYGKDNGHQRAVIDLQHQKLDEKIVSTQNETYCQALGQGTLLGVEHAGSASDTTSLVLAKLPDYTEVARVAFAVGGSPLPRNRETGCFVSDDRRTIVYGVGRTIVCRRAEDLGLLWTREIEPGFIGVRSFALTPDGSRVAAAIIDTFYIADQKNCYVSVMDGTHGSPVARIPVNGFEGIGLSANGTVLASSSTVFAKSKQAQVLVELREVSTGRLLSTVVQDQFSSGQQNLFFRGGFCRIEFTSDGRYLVTQSGAFTKVWELQQNP
jgi:hypothetical protein